MSYQIKSSYMKSFFVRPLLDASNILPQHWKWHACQGQVPIERLRLEPVQKVQHLKKINIYPEEIKIWLVHQRAAKQIAGLHTFAAIGSPCCKKGAEASLC